MRGRGEREGEGMGADDVERGEKREVRRDL